MAILQKSKPYVLGIVYILIGLLFPIFAFAHGGVEKIVGNTIVFLNQTPLAPFVGEQVHLPFVFTDQKTNLPLSHIPVTLTVTDTFLGDETKDKIIYSTTSNTDVNGLLDFSYTFHKENYFDIDLHFADSSGKDQETGFLVQARTSSVLTKPLFFFGLGILCGFFFFYRKRVA